MEAETLSPIHFDGVVVELFLTSIRPEDGSQGLKQLGHTGTNQTPAH